VAEVIEAALLPVALAARVDEGQPVGTAGVQEAPLELEDELVRRAIAAIARGGDRVAVPDQGTASATDSTLPSGILRRSWIRR
jgi:hypothetical protein